MGSHNYVAKFFIEELLPKFKLSEWSMAWFAGVPILQFYFPIPYLLMAIFRKIIGYQVAFKLVTVLGIFLLPAAAYIYGRLLKIPHPFPQLASVAAIAFLFMKSFSIYGRNIMSTLAGEFDYSLSFAHVFIFMGTLYLGIERRRFDWLFILNSILLAVLTLFRRKDLQTLPLIWNIYSLVIAFLTLTNGRLWNARLLPFIYFSIYLWAAYGL